MTNLPRPADDPNWGGHSSQSWRVALLDLTPPVILLALLACLVLALSGCTTVRYVQTACITQAQLDQLKAAKPGKVHDLLNGQADHDIKPITARLIRVEAWGDGLFTVLGGCVEK